MREATTQVEIDDRGRIQVPVATRKKLGVLGKRALVDITIAVIEMPEKATTENPLRAPEVVAVPALLRAASAAN